MAKGNNSKGRSYAVMLLLAFGAALFGVMLLQKFRERRIFNLLVKEKDHELFSLQLLLQKERDYTKELKKRSEEMKAKMYSLRTQKMLVDSRILEMQSMIASLQDEQRAMKSGLEEKQNEINMLTEKETESRKENPQAIAFTEILKQKEAEIEDLKHRVEYWSVSTDDPSNPSVNLTENVSTTTQSRKSEGSERKGESRGRGESADDNDGKSTGGEEGRSENDKDGNKDADRRGMAEEKLQKPEHSQHNGFQDGVDAEKIIDEEIEKKNGDAQRGFGAGEGKSSTNASETTQRTKEGDGQQEKLKNSQENEEQEPGKRSEGGMKLKMGDISNNSANLRMRGRHGHLSNTKGKRWRMLAKNRRLEHNRDFTSSRISKSEEGSERSHQNRNTDSILNVSLIQEKGKLDISEKSKQDEDRKEEDDGSNNITGDVRKQKQEESGSHNSSDTNKVDDNNAVKSKVSTVQEEPDELEVADNHESNTNAADGDIIVESRSDIEDDREEYKEETDESEF